MNNLSTYKVFEVSENGKLINTNWIDGVVSPYAELEIGVEYKIIADPYKNQTHHAQGFLSFENASEAFENHLKQNVNFNIVICEVEAIGGNISISQYLPIITPKIKIKRIIPESEYSEVLDKHEFIHNFRNDANSTFIRYYKSPNVVHSSYIIYGDRITRKIEIGKNRDKSHNYDFIVNDDNKVTEIRLHGVPVFGKNKYMYHKKVYFDFIKGYDVVEDSVTERLNASDYNNGLRQCFGFLTSKDRLNLPKTSSSAKINYEFIYSVDKTSIIGRDKVTNTVVTEMHRYFEDLKVVKIESFYTGKYGVRLFDTYLLEYNSDNMVTKVTKNDNIMIENIYDDMGLIVETKTPMDRYINGVKYTYDVGLNIWIESINATDGLNRYYVKEKLNDETITLMTKINGNYRYYNEYGKECAPYLIVVSNIDTVEPSFRSLIQVTNSESIDVTFIN